MRSTIVLLTIVLAFAIPGVAAAATTNAPPGNSGISQYLEVVPSSTGGKPSSRDPNKPSPLSKQAQGTLDKSKDGQTLSRVIDNTAPEPTATTPAAKHKATKKKAKTTTSTTTTQAGGGDDKTSTAAQDAEAVALAYKGGSGGGGGGSGIGVPLIVLMAGAALVVGAIAAVRHRSGPSADAEPEL
jgi:hypothetical protein